MTSTPLKGREGRQMVADGVRSALRVGDLVPGQRLIEQDLSEQFGVTRSAVREALIDLQSDQLVELVPNRGARIRVVSVEEAIQITECRAALERLCARKAAEHGSEADRAVLNTIANQMQTAVANGDVETYSALNRQLHALVIDMSGQEVAAQQLARLNGQTVRFQFRLARRPGRPQVSLPQHLAIIDGVLNRDPDAAEAAVKAHLDSVIEQLAQTA